MKKNFTLIFSLCLLFLGFSNVMNAQGSENFSNIPTDLSSGYNPRSWSGTDGVTWSATNARTDQTLTGKAICLNSVGSITSPTYTGGMGNLKFNYVRGFTGTGARTIQVFVNGTQIGSDIIVSTSSNTVVEFNQDINIEGNILLQIKTSGAQIKIDDIVWTAYSTTTPTLIASESVLNFGTAVVGSTAPTKTFTLTGSNLTGNVSLISDNPAFTISPASPYTPTSGTVNQTVTVTYTPSASPATHTGKLTISSASATSIEINLSGETILGTPVATAATDIQQSSFTANWNAVSGAGSYILNVYKKVGTAEVTVFSENFDKFTAGSPNAGANGTDVS
ncbi:MAG: hypothetical protein ACK5MK_10305, partial [Dysgonomonas sp.]